MLRIHDRNAPDSLWSLHSSPIAAALIGIFMAGAAYALPPLNTYDLVLSSPPVSVGEGDGMLSVQVQLDSNPVCTDTMWQVDWMASIIPLETDAMDLGTPTPATLTFSAATSTVTVNVPIFDDPDFEPDELFELSLQSVSTGEIPCLVPSAFITPNLSEYRFQFLLVDNDSPPPMPEFTVAPVFVDETDPGAVFSVFLDDQGGKLRNRGVVSVDVFTEDGSALAGQDYTAVPLQTLTFPFGTNVQTVTVPILNDSIPEPIEEFTLKLQNPVGATILTTFATGEITDDDPFVLDIIDVGVLETDPGDNPNIAIPVQVTPPAPFSITVDFQTQDGTATAGLDYSTAMGTLTIPANAPSAEIMVPMIGDSEQEGAENFFVILSNPSTGSAIGTGTSTVEINDNDGVGPELFLRNAADTFEGDPGDSNQMIFAVDYVDPGGKARGVIQVDYTTLEDSAFDGDDFIPQSGTLQFTPQDPTQFITIDLVGDTIPEATEQLFVVLSNPIGAGLGNPKAPGLILDDDRPGGMPEVTVADVAVDEGDDG
ncbi:MAG: Calx-beta domain-containing protein, partial [Acidobacteriota bacterium]